MRFTVEHEGMVRSTDFTNEETSRNFDRVIGAIEGLLRQTFASKMRRKTLKLVRNNPTEMSSIDEQTNTRPHAPAPVPISNPFFTGQIYGENPTTGPSDGQQWGRSSPFSYTSGSMQSYDDSTSPADEDQR